MRIASSPGSCPDWQVHGQMAHSTQLSDVKTHSRVAGMQGLVPEKKVFEVHIEQGHKYGAKVVLRGEAGMSELGVQPGDVIFVLEPKPHKIFKRVGNDLILEKVRLLNGSVVASALEVFLKQHACQLSRDAYQDVHLKRKPRSSFAWQHPMFRRQILAMQLAEDDCLPCLAVSCRPGKTRQQSSSDSCICPRSQSALKSWHHLPL